MKLSEAIRLGAMLRPQGFGDGTGNPRAQKLCAIGAASAATGSESILHTFPFLLDRQLCPACGYGARTLYIVIVHLNDAHLWTREQIADFIETLEPHEAAPAVQPATMEVGA